MKFLAAIAIAALFVITWIGVNIVHFLYFPVNVVLYDALMDVVISATLFLLAGLALRKKWRILSALETFLALTVGVLIAANLSITVPTIIDRSLSIYILEKLAQRGGKIKIGAFPDIFIHEYMVEDRLVDIRLTEQLESRTITIDHDCVRLTDRGAMIAAFTRYYRTHFLPKQRKIMGVYTDDLTDPFRNSAPADYSCASPGPDAGNTK